MKASEALAIIEPIPSDLFITYKLKDNKGRCCFVGHINMHTHGYAYFKSEDDDSATFIEQSRDFLEAKYSVKHTSIVDVNNSPIINSYNEPEVKDRLVHFIKDMIEAGY